MLLFNRRFVRDAPLLVCALCFVSLPIAINQMVRLGGPVRLSIAGVALVCWMLAVLVGLFYVFRPTAALHSPSGMTLLQLFLLLAGVIFMCIAVVIPGA